MIIGILTISMLLTVFIIPFLIKYAAQLKLVDLPNERKIHLQAVPRVGGIAMVIGALLPVLLLTPGDNTKYGALAAFAIVFLFGIWDDRGDLNYKFKFLGQFLAAFFVVVIGDVSIRWLPFTDIGPLADWVSFPLTIFCLLAITNAVAISDGLDGLTGGSSLLYFIILGVLAWVAEDILSIVIAVSIIGSILGFLRYNSHPAIIFMGDTGSQFLGFSVGAVAILLTQHSYTALSPFFPVLLFGLTIIDTAWVMIARVFSGKSPFKADKGHIHHRLLSLGFSHFEVVVIIYLIHIIFILSALYFRFSSDFNLLLIFIFITTLIVGGLHFLKKIEWKKNEIIFFPYLIRLEDKHNFKIFLGLVKNIFSSNLIYFFIPLLLINLNLELKNLSADLLILSIVLFLLVLFRLLIPRENLFIDRILFYIFSALLCFLGFEKGYLSNYTIYFDMFYIFILGLLLFSYVLFSYRDLIESKNFNISPTDILISLLILILPLLSLIYDQNLLITIAIVKFVILLYFFEIILVESKHLISMKLFIMFFIGIITSKALFNFYGYWPA